MRCEGPFICFLIGFCLLPLRCAVAIACAAHCFSRSNTPRGTLCVDVIGSGLRVVEIFLIQQSGGRWKIFFVFQKRYWRWRSSRREKPYMRWDASFQPSYMVVLSVRRRLVVLAGNVVSEDHFTSLAFCYQFLPHSQEWQMQN